MIKTWFKYLIILISAFVIGLVVFLILPLPSSFFVLKDKTFKRGESVGFVANSQNKGEKCKPKTVYYFEENGYTQSGEGIANAYCAELQENLVSAIASDNFELVRGLLSVGANVNSPNNDYALAYPMVVAVKGNDVEMVKLLLDNDGDVNKANVCCISFESLLMLAIEENDVEMVKLLLSRGADVNFKGYENQSVLMEAEKSNNQEIKDLIADTCRESMQCKIKLRVAKLLNNLR